MPQLDYVIYRISPAGAPVRMENANNLQAARISVTQLAQKFAGSFAVYDSRSSARGGV